MELAALAFSLFVGIAAVTACLRGMKTVIHLINKAFDKIEDKFG